MPSSVDYNGRVSIPLSGNAPSSASTSSSSAAANGSPARSSPFAYQQKLIDRSASKSAGLAGSGSSSSIGYSGGIPGPNGGLSHSTSVRKYPLPSNHRHTSSLDPQRFSGSPSTRWSQTVGPSASHGLRQSTTTEDDDGSPSTPGTPTPSSPTKNQFNSPHRLASSNVGIQSSSAGGFGSPAFSRVNRGLSMPPAPREGSSGTSSSPSSPIKSSAPFPSGPFARAPSPTKLHFDRPASPSKSPGLKSDASWITGSPSAAQSASFWSTSNPSASPGPSTPTAVHLGGVGDLKKSSVGALKMMRNFAAKSDAVTDHASGDPGHTRMTVGKARGATFGGDRAEASPSHANGALDFQKPDRPGRMESEDQAGEIYIPGITTGAEDVSGLHGRIRLARQDAAGAGSMALGKSPIPASSNLPFASSSKWMDTQRHLLQAYEYLCHCGEAKQWMEACVGEALGDVVDMENEMRNGVFLAKVARHFEPQLVPRIFAHPKLQYRHTDNVNYFFRFVENVGLPVFFHFELTDLYEKKNFPKVVYCIHALSHILARQGRSVKVSNLVGKLEFTDDELQKTQKGLDASGVAMPSFGGLGKALAKEMNEEPEPEPEPQESEEDRINRELNEAEPSVIELQAASRGVLARAKFARLQAQEAARRAAEAEARRLQAEAEAEARAREEERRRREAEERQRQLEEEAERLRLQREEEERLRIAEERAAEVERQRRQRKLELFAPILQAQVRGHLARNAYDDLTSRLTGATADIIKVQTAFRSHLARKTLLAKIRGLRASSPHIVQMQAQVRGVLARRRFGMMMHALRRVEVVRSVNGLQNVARAALVRKRHQEQQKKFFDVTPEITGLQAHIRGMFARQEYDWWRNHLYESEPVAIHLQSLIRGLLARRAFNSKLRHYHEHMDKIVKIQSLFRGKQQGEQYRSLTMGKNVPVSTIKNFGHLLNDSDHDFEDEIEVERLRKLVVRNIRENQTLEHDVTELDGKIALLVRNKIGIEELVKARNERGLLRQRELAEGTLARHNSVLEAAGDPFAETTLDRNARRRRELYQELFYSLQTRPEYLARLFAYAGSLDMSDKQRKSIERIVLTLFGYAQNAREEYLLLKLFQRCIGEEMLLINAPEECLRGQAQFIKLVVQYNRGDKERQYLGDLLAPAVRGLVEDDGLDLETDPSAIYRATINQEEMETGRPSPRPLDVDYQAALADPMARTIFIRHLQALRAMTEAFLSTIIGSSRSMPFGIRYIGRELFRALQTKFPHEPEDQLIKVVAHLIYYRYLNPAIVAPETFDVIEKVVGPLQRKNLAEVSKMMTHISNGHLFTDENPYLQPLNDYVSQASQRFMQWLYAVIDVPDAEMHFNADEFLDHSSINSKPVVYISPSEIYSMHQLVAEQVDLIAPSGHDPLRATLHELGAPPASGSQELADARTSEITFELVCRRTSLKDPEADTKALFVETKRLVLSLLKVQSGKTLMDVFLTPVTDQDEATWEEIVSLEAAGDVQRQNNGTQERHRSILLEDVRRLSFAELKARTLENMLQLEAAGKVSRAAGYQEMLNSIAIDIRQKHRKRIQRHNEKTSMLATLDNLSQKKRYLEEQIASYHSYVDASMATMQKKGTKKRFVIPFTQQYFHLRSLKQQGKVPQFGSYKYTAARLHERGILLSVDDFVSDDKTFDQLTLTISSDQPGLFTIDASFLGVKSASTDLRIEDLLEQQHEGSSTTVDVAVGDSKATCSLNLLIHLINRKFYA